MANTIGQLDSSFTNLISNLMVIERQPLLRLTALRDTVVQKKAILTDLKTKLDALLNATKTLRPSDTFFSLSPGRKVSVASNTTGSTIVTALASSTSVPGNYVISDVTLAKAHSVMSDRQAYSDQDLDYTGVIFMGGAESRSQITNTTNAAVSGFGTGESLDGGQPELGSGNYYIETRTSSGVQQFRIVDSEGKSVNIRKDGNAGSYTTTWQNLPAVGTFNTGRGLTLDFSGGFVNGTKGSGAASVTYTAKGTSLDIVPEDSLVDIASKINNASYPTGNEVLASIVDNQLILTAKYSGSQHTIKASGAILGSLGILNAGDFKHVNSIANDASFKVNGLSVTRSQNSNLTDVVSGVTLNLTADAEGVGKSATITLIGDVTPQKNAISDFLRQYNGIQTYLSAKTAVTKKDDGTYERAALAGDSMMTALKLDLSRVFVSGYTNSGTLSRLRDIGISLDDNGQAAITDSTKLESALSNNYNNVKFLLDSAMTDMTNKLNRYTGTSSYVTTAISAADKESTRANGQITTMNERLAKKEQQLRDQFAAAQSTLQSLAYEQQTITAGFNSMNSLY